MNFSLASLRSKALSGLFLVGYLVSGVVSSLAQSSVHPSPVEVVTPKPPTPAVIEGRQLLVYELHITNFASSPLKLTEIQVFATGEKPSPNDVTNAEKLADYTGSALTELLHPLGEPMQ